MCFNALEGENCLTGRNDVYAQLEIPESDFSSAPEVLGWGLAEVGVLGGC